MTERHVGGVAMRRTECSCLECSEHCVTRPGCCGPGDVQRISAFLQEPLAVTAGHFWASPGATVLDLATGTPYRIGTIVPRRDADGRCVFLAADGKCSIHPVSPAGCALFDAHMSPLEGLRRGTILAAAQRDDVVYQALRGVLEKAPC